MTVNSISGKLAIQLVYQLGNLSDLSELNSVETAFKGLEKSRGTQSIEHRTYA